MYNSKEIEDFIEKVNEEAIAAAQAIFDKHQPELERRIKAQMNIGDKFSIGMGSADFENKKGEEVGKKLADILSSTQYEYKDRAGFSLPDITK